MGDPSVSRREGTQESEFDSILRTGTVQSTRSGSRYECDLTWQGSPLPTPVEEGMHLEEEAKCIQEEVEAAHWLVVAAASARAELRGRVP